MESGKFAAEAAVEALRRASGPAREDALAKYPKRMQQEWGAYYRLGAIFVKLIGNPKVMQACTRHGLPHPALMRFVLKLLANLTDPHDGDLSDRVISVLTRLTPAVR
jgi:flavin-dependent dehydrogenase